MALTVLPQRHHPKTSDHLRSALARLSFLELIGLFIGTLLVVSFVLGLGYRATLQHGESRSLLHWWHEGLMMLTTIPLAGATTETGDDLRRVVQAVAATAGLVIPALFLGSVIFKFFLSPDVFVFRERIGLLKNPVPHDRLQAGGHHLAIRMYSSTRLELVDLCAVVVLELHGPVAGSGNVAKYRAVPTVNPSWPVGITHLPHTLRIELQDGDVVFEDGVPRLLKVRGYEVNDVDRLFVLISAKVPELGNEFVERRSFSLLEAVSTEPFTPIEPDLNVASKKWPGWLNFDT